MFRGPDDGSVGRGCGPSESGGVGLSGACLILSTNASSNASEVNAPEEVVGISDSTLPAVPSRPMSASGANCCLACPLCEVGGGTSCHKKKKKKKKTTPPKTTDTRS